MTTEHARYFHLGADAPQPVEIAEDPRIVKLREYLQSVTIYTDAPRYEVECFGVRDCAGLAGLLREIRDGI